MSRMLRALAMAGAIAALAACDNSTAPKSPPVTIENTTFSPAIGVNLAAMTRTTSGIYYRDLAVGTGTPIDTGNTVQVRYAGFLPNGSAFDQTLPTAGPFTFVLGTGKVIKGWDQGLVGMQVGGQRQLVIPPELGYGEAGTSTIPSNSVLVFVVTVVGAS